MFGNIWTERHVVYFTIFSKNGKQYFILTDQGCDFIENCSPGLWLNGYTRFQSSLDKPREEPSTSHSFIQSFKASFAKMRL